MFRNGRLYLLNGRQTVKSAVDYTTHPKVSLWMIRPTAIL